MKKYVYTTKARQIHMLRGITQLCHATPENSRECGRVKAWWLNKVCGYDFCGHCCPEKSKYNG